MSSTSDMIVTRFAPSPTGQLHIGGARTALFCWAFARKHGGHFVLRIEDTDQARSTDASTRSILDSLAWLGIDWDEGPSYCGFGLKCGGDPRGVGPFEQSNRLELYNRVFSEMLEKDLAYAAFDTPAELEAKRKEAVARKETYRYDRAALSIPRSERDARVRAGEPHVIRLRAPSSEIVVKDEVLGDVRFGAGELEDFVLRKADGFPTYHFAVVVDDEHMGVTHVLRGQEHLNNTPKHVALQRSLAYRTPVYAHMPLIFNEQGSKMSKRERDMAAREAAKKAGITKSPVSLVDEATFSAWLGDKKRQLEPEQVKAVANALHLHLPEVSVGDFREAGYLPQVICNFIALLGWTPGKHDDGTDREKFDMKFLERDFDMSRIGKTNARFDRVKLASFNQDAIAAMSDEEFAAKWRAWCEEFAPEVLSRITGHRFDLLAKAIRLRCKTFGDSLEVGRFALTEDDGFEFDAKSVEKVMSKGEPNGYAVLAEFREVLSKLAAFEPAPIEEALKDFCEQRGLGMGKVAQPLRIAVTGTPVSPPIGETLAVLGKQSVLNRIDRCLTLSAVS